MCYFLSLFKDSTCIILGYHPHPCNPDPCKNGICVDKGGNNYECHCNTGYVGANCGMYLLPLIITTSKIVNFGDSVGLTGS